ncbi:MAG: divalent cation tolerance protein CutA [Verrucomicrobia bacterium]|nr:divalent cation tolerance protein CutA [Verrucomicrobiota bacterium]
MSRYLVGMVTCASRAEARALARAVLEPKLAACVNIVPVIESHYWWQGKLERSAECLLLIKTTGAKAPSVMRAIKAAHGYEVPEIIFLSVARGEKRYLKWLRDAVMSVAFCCLLGTARGDVVDDLLGQLRSGNDEARAEAADRLTQLGGERVVNQFRVMIASANGEARQMAVTGLLRVSDADADLELVHSRLRDDSDSMVRWSAALALGQSGRREAVSWLETAVKSDASAPVREMAAESLAKLRGQVTWWRSLDEALKEARKSKRLVLAYFFVPDSAYCRQFESGVLAAGEVAGRAMEFVCARVDAAVHGEQARRYDVRGVPTVVLLDGKGGELSRAAGMVEKERLLARMAQAQRGTDSFRELQQQATQAPSDVTANWKVAALCLDEGREDLAEPHLRNVIAHDESNRRGHTADALLALGVVLGQQGRHAKAAYCYEQLLERWPAFARKDKALYCLGLSRLALGQNEKGRAALEQLARECPSSTVVKQATEALQKLGAR